LGSILADDIEHRAKSTVDIVNKLIISDVFQSQQSLRPVFVIAVPLKEEKQINGVFSL
jgi:hypothetical protein